MARKTTSTFAFSAVAALSLCMITDALAEDFSQAEDYVTAYGGWFDVVRHKYDAAQFGGEYRFSPVYYSFIRPTLGANITSDGEFYGYAGFNFPIQIIKDKLILDPNEMVGLNHEGSGRQLGGAIEFRSGVEIDYEFDNKQQLGLAFNHISNASIYYHNPGAETAILTYSVPFSNVRSFFSNSVGW